MEKKFYFVVETQRTLFTDELRPNEKAKIAYGKEHFKALGNDVEFTVQMPLKNFQGNMCNQKRDRMNP